MTARHGWSIIVTVSALMAGCASTTKPVASATDDARSSEPARPAPVVAEAPAPPPKRLTDRPAWWLDEPALTPTGFAATVEAEGASVLEARASAVELAMQAAATYDRADDARIDKTLIINPSPGVYKAFVYVSTPGATAQVPESP